MKTITLQISERQACLIISAMSWRSGRIHPCDRPELRKMTFDTMAMLLDAVVASGDPTVTDEQSARCILVAGLCRGSSRADEAAGAPGDRIEDERGKVKSRRSEA